MIGIREDVFSLLAPLLCEHSGQDLTRPRECDSVLGEVKPLVWVCSQLSVPSSRSCRAGLWLDEPGLVMGTGCQALSVGLAMAQRVVGLRLEEGMGRQPCG